MGHDWRAYDGCLEPKTNRNWMTAVRTQGQNECVAYGTLAVLESMLKIHYYNDAGKADFDLFDAKIDNTDKNLMQKMEGYRSVVNACTILQRDGIIIPDRSAAYKIAGWYQIGSSAGRDDVPAIITEAKKYLVTNGPLIATYQDPTAGFHCVAIVGYTDDSSPGAGDGKWICKDSYYGRGGYTDNIGVSQMILGTAQGGYAGSLYAITLQKLKISIRKSSSSTSPINDWDYVHLRIKRGTVNLVENDPSFVSMFPNLGNTGRSDGWRGISVLIYRKNNQRNLDDLEVVVVPGTYDIEAHVCVPQDTLNFEGQAIGVEVNDGNTEVQVTVLINSVEQCSREILYPFALDAMKRGPSEDEKADINVALRLLLRTAEISKEEFIEYLDQRLVELDKAHGYGSNGAFRTRQATEEIQKLVRSIED